MLGLHIQHLATSAHRIGLLQHNLTILTKYNFPNFLWTISRIPTALTQVFLSASLISFYKTNVTIIGGLKFMFISWTLFRFAFSQICECWKTFQVPECNQLENICLQKDLFWHKCLFGSTAFAAFFAVVPFLQKKNWLWPKFVAVESLSNPSFFPHSKRASQYQCKLPKLMLVLVRGVRTHTHTCVQKSFISDVKLLENCWMLKKKC